MADFAKVTVERDVPGRDDRPGTTLRFPFNPGVQSALMEAVPSRDRYWWPERSAWWVAADSEDVALAVLFGEWGEILFIGTEGESDYLMDRHGTVVGQPGLFD